MPAAKIIKQLLAKNGPMTNQALYKYVDQYPQLVSKTYVKTKVLQTLEGQGILYKKINRETSKPTWEWHFMDAEVLKKYQNM